MHEANLIDLKGEIDRQIHNGSWETLTPLSQQLIETLQKVKDTEELNNTSYQQNLNHL